MTIAFVQIRMDVVPSRTEIVVPIKFIVAQMVTVVMRVAVDAFVISLPTKKVE